MMMNKKQGITMISIVLYVLLFFSFIVFATAISTNMNFKTLKEKGIVYVNEVDSAVTYNLFKSAKASKECKLTKNTITFSNDDIYEFDFEKEVIYKNGKVIAKNSKVTTLNYETLASIKDGETVTSNNAIKLSISISKYEQNLYKTYTFKLGEI